MSGPLQLKNLSPLSLSSRRWWTRSRGASTLVVAKATYGLVSGELELTERQEAVAETDTFRDTPRGQVLALPSDLLPPKPRVDVIVVGSAHAPNGNPTRRLTSYITLGALEKGCEVRAERHLDLRGELHEGPAQQRFSLGWEHAAGGPDTPNPVGRAGNRDERGRLFLPSIQPVTFDQKPPDYATPIVGFGPVASHWSTRRAALRGHQDSWSERWLETGLPDDFDYSFFQLAPRDQQLEKLELGATIVLENLHRGGARCVARLPRHRVRCVVEPYGHEVAMEADTLWIDTDRDLVTVTYRASLPQHKLPEARILLVAQDTPERALDLKDIRALHAASGDGSDLPFSNSGSRPIAILSPSNDRGPVAKTAPGVPVERGSQPGFAGTPFGPGANRKLQPARPVAELPSLQTMELPAVLEELGTSDIEPEGLRPAEPKAAEPARYPTPARVAPPQGPPATIRQSVAPQAPAQPQAMQPQAMHPQAPAVQPQVVAQPIAPPQVVPPAPQPPATGATVGQSYSAAQAARAGAPSYLANARSEAPPAFVRHEANAGHTGVAAASNAAASVPPRAEVPSADNRAPVEGKRPKPQGYFDLLWFDEAAPERIHGSAVWSKLVGDGKKTEWLSNKAEEGRAKLPPQRVVARALARGTPVNAQGVATAVLDAVDDDGFLVRPIVIVEGEVQLAFDVREILAATLSFAEVPAASDRKLKETYDAAAEHLKDERRITAPMLDAATQRLRQAFAAAGNRNYPPQYLETAVERWLLDERRFQKRVVLGEARLVGTITPLGANTPLTLYLPAALEQVVPTLARFKARVLAEPHGRQESAEGETTLLALAFARVMNR